MPNSMKSTAYLTITRISGNPDQLLNGYRHSAEVMESVGRDHGLLFHAAARTDSGLLIANLWPSKDGSEAAAQDPRRLGTVRQHGLNAAQIRPEHHEVANYVLFE